METRGFWGKTQREVFLPSLWWADLDLWGPAGPRAKSSCTSLLPSGPQSRGWGSLPGTQRDVWKVRAGNRGHSYRPHRKELTAASITVTRLDKEQLDTTQQLGLIHPWLLTSRLPQNFCRWTFFSAQAMERETTPQFPLYFHWHEICCLQENSPFAHPYIHTPVDLLSVYMSRLSHTTLSAGLPRGTSLLGLMAETCSFITLAAHICVNASQGHSLQRLSGKK